MGTCFKRKSSKFIAEFDPDVEPVVGLVTFKDNLYLATNRRVYILNEKEKFEPIKIVSEQESKHGTTEQNSAGTQSAEKSAQ